MQRFVFFAVFQQLLRVYSHDLFLFSIGMRV